MRHTHRYLKNLVLSGFAASAIPLLAQGYLSATESNKKVVFDFYRLVVEPRNADLIELYVAPDFLDHDLGDQKGNDAVAKKLKALGPAASQDVGATLRKPPALVMAQGDLVVWCFSNTAKSAEPFTIEVYRVRDRKIVEHWTGGATAP